MLRRVCFLMLLGLLSPAVVDADRATATPHSAGPGARLPRAPASVTTELQLRRAWADPTRTRIELGADIVLRDCFLGDPIRETPYPLILDGNGHAIRQSCFEKRVLRQDGTGFLDLRDITLSRGGSDGPGAALTSRGEILLSDCVIKQNLAEEPGGGVFSMRRVTVHRCHINGNLANDDGGGIYARRGGVQVYDSVLSTNLVDGSGGAIGSTGDILVVRSFVDGNTTDGDGGALYADEDGDVTVIDSFIDGSDADGPGGAIFTLDGDVAVFDSTLNGNRADDRGGAISGEADVLVVNSTIARNLAVAHAGGGIWARGDLVLDQLDGDRQLRRGRGRRRAVGRPADADRQHRGQQHRLRSAATSGLPGGFRSFATIVGPPVSTGVTGDTIPTSRALPGATARRRSATTSSPTTTCLLDRPRGRPRRRTRSWRQLEADTSGFVLVPASGQPGPRPDPERRLQRRAARPAARGPAPRGRTSTGTRSSTRDAGRHPARHRAACDIGAVQSDDAARAARRPAARSAPRPGRGAGRRARRSRP